MKLYHGTDAANLAAIRAHGVRPRAATRRPSNWGHTIESNPHAVYLTDTYALYFAVNGAADDSWPAILELDTEALRPDLLAPDEDALEQATRVLPTDGVPPELRPGAALEGMVTRTRWFRRHALRLANFWPVSVELLGTCAYYGPVPPAAITRVAVIDPDTAPAMTVALDPMVSISNHRFCGAFYRNATRAIFGDPATEPDHTGVDAAKLEALAQWYERNGGGVAARETRAWAQGPAWATFGEGVTVRPLPEIADIEI